MGVLVIGMHRSGTSALSGLLEGLGLDAGPSDGLMPADAGNPDGYFEQRAVVTLSDEILASYGGRWDCPPVFASGWASDLKAEHFVVRVRELVGSSFASPLFVLKDPRLSLLLPVWRPALLDRGCAVVIVRDPAEVAWSLALRDALPTLTGLALWSAYNRTLLRELSGLPVHVCTYEDLLERPAEVIREIVASLQAWGEAPPSLDLATAVGRVKPSLRRSTIPASQLELVAPPPEVAALHKFLGDLRGRHDAFDAGTLLEAGWWEAPLLEERRTILQRTWATVAAIEAINADLERDNVALREQSEELRVALDAATARLDQLRRSLPVRALTTVRRMVRRRAR